VLFEQIGRLNGISARLDRAPVPDHDWKDRALARHAAP
jgi:hypothetical protein